VNFPEDLWSSGEADAFQPVQNPHGRARTANVSISSEIDIAHDAAQLALSMEEVEVSFSGRAEAALGSSDTPLAFSTAGNRRCYAGRGA